MANVYKVEARVWLTVSANSADEAIDQAEDRMETAKDYFDNYEIIDEPDNIGDDDDE
jgi:flavin-binding protein dodecin